MEQKEKLVQQAVAGKWLSFLEHDPEYACGVIEEENGKPFLRPLAERSAPPRRVGPARRV
jgi:hypothetical protein